MKKNRHVVEFNQPICLTLKASDGDSRLLQAATGMQVLVGLAPQHLGRREVADLHFPDGSVAHAVAFEYFHFVDMPQGGDSLDAAA